MDDTSLVQRARAGEIDALAGLFDRHAGRIHDSLWWALGDRAAADDALARTFLRAAARIHRAPERGDDVLAWLYAQARREALGPSWSGGVLARWRFGRRLAGSRLGRRLGIGGEPGPAVVGAGRARGADAVLDDAAALLTAEDRLLFDLGFRQAFAADTIADILGTTAPEAAGRVRRARRRAAEAIGLATLAAQGSGYCTGLTMIVPPVAAPLTPALARRVEHHARGCARCRPATMATAEPEVLLRRAPAFARPADVRARVLGTANLASPRFPAWPAPLLAWRRRARTRGGRGWGWAPGRAHGRPPPRPLTLAATGAAGAVAVVVALALLVDQPSRSTPVSAGARSTAVPTTTRAPATTRPAASTTTTAATTTSVAVTPARATTPTTARPRPTPATQPPATAPSPPPTTAAPTTPPSTTPPDNDGPQLSGLVVTPATPACDGSVTVTVKVTDPSGVQEVTATLLVPHQEQVMTSTDGTTYSAMLGPLKREAALTGTQVIVTAVDTRGNSNVLTSERFTCRN